MSVTLITGPLKQEQGQPVKFSPSGQIVRFSVKDYGKGIDKKDFTTIFEPFSQASKETQTIYGGTGLGLSITSKLVHRLGGTVGLDSEPGKFTEFTVDLPFDGTAVDIADVRRKMAQTTLIVVEPGIKDYSFNEDPFKPEPISFDKEVTSIYGLDVVRCCSLHDAADQLSERKKQGMDRHFALLVQENLFNFDAKDMIDAIVNSSECTLMTFGPNFSVDLTKGWHFKSLLGVFPATLLETIAYYRLRQVQSLGSSSSTDSDPSACATVKEVPETTANREEKSFDHVSIQSDTVLSHEANKGLFALLAVEGCEQSRKGEETSAFLSPMAELNETNPSASRTKPVNSSAGGLFASLSRAGGFQEVVPAMRETSPKPTPKSADGLFVPLRRDDGKVANSTGSLQNSLSIRKAGGTGTSRGLSSGSSLRQIVPVKRSSKTRPPKRALKVMYVEDNVINQKVFSKMLSRAGIDDITIVDNGQKAVDMCDSETFDVIFMDYEMPVMDGMEATKLIVHRDPNAKVIFVTAHALEEFKMEARSVGAIGFFSKPVRPRDIEDLLDSLDVVNKKDPTDSFEASPLHRDTTTVSKTIGSRLSVPKRQLKVLYAEDNIINQKVLSKALNRSGLTDVTIVGNGKLAVELCQSMEYDCVFMDVEMPVMGGLEACKEIMEKNPSARVVFVTAHTLEEFRKKGDAVGAWDYVSKPFRLKDIDELLDRLEVACSKPHFDLEEPAIISDSPPLGFPPPNTPASAVKAVKTAKAPPRDRHLKVLYAEDNLVNQKVLCRILNRAGISDVTIVDNGKSAVDLCRSVNYSCIFLDMQMPVMDGIEACRQIVKNDPNATVIFVTAHALDEFKAQTVAIGAKSFITKPFRLSDIQKVLDELNLE